MAKRGDIKGKNFERLVAALFRDATGLDIRRTPLSGGWANGVRDVAGDLVAVDEPDKFLYCVECKKKEGWSLDSLFTPNHKWFDDWWKQAVNQCPKGKTPILVFSRNRAPIYVAMTKLLHIEQPTPRLVPILEMLVHNGRDYQFIVIKELCAWLEYFRMIAIPLEEDNEG